MRITVKHVREVFQTFCDVAQKEGFDVEYWTLKEGNSSAGISYSMHIRDPHSGGLRNHPFGDYLGWTASEAYGTLSAYIRALNVIH